MQFNIINEGHYPLLQAVLNKGERVFCEADAMVTMGQHLELNARMQGGLLSAVARKFANGEGFFTQEIIASYGEGMCLLAPTLPGDIKVLDLGNKQYFLNDGVFLANSEGINIVTRMQSIGRAIFGGTGGFFIMETCGQGKLAIAGFGSILELGLDNEEITIDNKHVLAWDSQIRYDLSVSTNKSQGLLRNLVNSALSSEGIVTKFHGMVTVIKYL